MALRDYDRYVNNSILKASTRPQVSSTCSVNAMATAINAAFGLSLFPSEVEEICGWKRTWVQDGEVGNDELEWGMKEIIKQKKLSGKVTRFLTSVKLGEQNIEKTWTRLKKAIRAKNIALIYHMPGHYTVLGGYFEEPWDVKSKNSTAFENRRDWVVIAEHSRNKKDTPIWCMTWKELRCDIRDDSNHMIFRVSKL